jgi:putative tricarboxylic transport membrane protein
MSKTPEFAMERNARGLFEFTMAGKEFDDRVKADVVRFKQMAKDAGM